MDEEYLPANYRAPFPYFARMGLAVSDHTKASQAAIETIKKGGNAVDAAVTLSLALGVVCPYYTGIGGGGFMIVWMPGMEVPRLLDYREVAPCAARKNMYAEHPDASTVGGMAVGVPGTIRGLYTLLQEFGKLSWAEVLEPAIALADQEIGINPNYARISWCKRDQIKEFAEAARIYLTEDGRVKRPGTKMRHPELAWTYRRLAEAGADDFYEGKIARRILQAVNDRGGIMMEKDLREYKPVWREPLCAKHRGKLVYTVGPPSGGGIQVLQILRILENFPHDRYDWGTVEGLHRLAEAMRISFQERSTRICDPAFHDVPVDWLLDGARLDALARKIGPKASPLEPAAGPLELPAGGTASFVVGVQGGGMVVATESVNLWHGSMVVPENCGFVMNNVMDDFSTQPGMPDAFGLISAAVNEVQPGKRPASSSSPVMVFEPGLGPVFAAGSAGGSRIPTSVVQMLINTLDHGMNVQQALSTPRVHHQWLPNHLYVEPQMCMEVRRGLEKLGHEVIEASARSHGCAMKWELEHGLFTGGSDFRSGGGSRGM